MNKQSVLRVFFSVNFDGVKILTPVSHLLFVDGYKVSNFSCEIAHSKSI
jgi:hypothetical protein